MTTIASLTSWKPRRGIFTAWTELIFGVTPLAHESTLILAPGLPSADICLLDFKIQCEQLDSSGRGLGFKFGILSGDRCQSFAPVGEAQLGVVPYGVVTPANLEHLKSDLVDRPLGLRVEHPLRNPSYWCGNGRRLVATFTYAVRAEAAEEASASKPRGAIGQLLGALAS